MANTQPEIGRTPGVESARKLLNVLFSFTPENPTITVEDVLASTGISTPSAYRYLSLLRELGIIEERARGRFALTPKILALAEAVDRTYDLDSIARPVMNNLVNAVHESVILFRRESDRAKCISIMQPDASLILSFKAGQRFPLHRAAGPKLLLAFASESFRESYLAKFVADPERASGLRTELRTVRENDVSFSSAEIDQGIWGIASPIRVDDHVVAALAVAGPIFRIPEDKQRQIEDALAAASASIGDRLSTERPD